ncbi:hypothetical protein HZB02_00805 [Candidatus Woesearchaeota archaeon]|nr:hypothetical protein [Candidatus Woesearchaeota archaeon]
MGSSLPKASHETLLPPTPVHAGHDSAMPAGIKKHGRPTLLQEPDCRDAVVSGKSIAEISDATSVPACLVYAYLAKYHLVSAYRVHYPALRQVPHFLSYDGLEDLIRSGPLLRTLAQHYHVSVSSISQVLQRRGLHDVWLNARKQMHNHNLVLLSNQRNALVQTLTAVAFGKAAGNKPLEKTLHYCLTHDYRSSTNVPSSDILLLFERYYAARDAGHRATTKSLVDGLRLSRCHAAHILRAVGEEPMHACGQGYFLKSQQPLSKEQIVQALSTNFLPYADLGALLGVPAPLFSRYSQHNLHHLSDHLHTSRLYHVSYRKAMDLYEALDVGFTDAEAQEYAGVTSDNVFTYLLSNRLKISTTYRNEVQRLKTLLHLDATLK